MTTQLSQFFQNHPLLGHLPPKLYPHLAHLSRGIALEAGGVLFRPGDEAHNIYIVATGSLRLVDYAAEQSVTLQIFSPGDIFSLHALHKQTLRYPAQAEAIEKSLVVALDAESLRPLLFQYPPLGQVFLDCLIERVHHIHDRVRQMAAERAEQRLARALLLLAEKFGRLEEDHLHLALPLSRQDLAQFIGATFETVSRICSDWERRGYIRTGRKQMSLLDEAAIRELAGANSSLV